MNSLLVYFAFPIATILLAIVLEKVLESPVLVGLTFFAIYLVITFAFFDSNFLIFAIAYTAIALITAFLAQMLCSLKRCREISESENGTGEVSSSNTCFCQTNSPCRMTGRIQFGTTASNRRGARR